MSATTPVSTRTISASPFKNATWVGVKDVAGTNIYDAQVTIEFDLFNGELRHTETLSMQMIATLCLNLLTLKQLSETALGMFIASCYDKSGVSFDALRGLVGAVFSENQLKGAVSASKVI